MTFPMLPLAYSSLADAAAGAIYTMREASKRPELPRWLRDRLNQEADAMEKTLPDDIS